MTTRHARTVFLSSRQRGAALVVSLMFLLIMTILGVTAMNTATLGTMMAGNAMFQATALSEAELILREGEEDIETNIVGLSPAKEWDTGGDHYYLRTGNADPNNLIDPSELDWSFTEQTSALVAGGSYVIELAVEDEVIPGEDVDVGCLNPGSCVDVYLVSTQSQHHRGAKRIVQGVYVTVD